jgi:hypothetical protein
LVVERDLDTSLIGLKTIDGGETTIRKHSRRNYASNQDQIDTVELVVSKLRQKNVKITNDVLVQAGFGKGSIGLWRKRDLDVVDDRSDDSDESVVDGEDDSRPIINDRGLAQDVITRIVDLPEDSKYSKQWRRDYMRS